MGHTEGTELVLRCRGLSCGVEAKNGLQAILGPPVRLKGIFWKLHGRKALDMGESSTV